MQILALHLEAVYWTLCRTRILIHNRTSGSFPFELAWGFCVLPLRHFLLRIKVLSSALRDYLADRSRGAHSPAWIGFSLLLAGGIGMTAWSLLSGADPFFAEVAEQVAPGVRLAFAADAANRDSLAAGRRVALWSGRRQFVPGRTGRPAVAMAGSAGPDAGFARLHDGAGDRRAVRNLRLFFAVEAYAYLTQLIAGAITVTLACQYAVQGFWQLCGIVLLNLSVLAVLHTLSETSLLAPGRLRSLAKLFSVCHDRVCPVSRIKAGDVRASLRLDAAPGAGGLGLERVGGRRRSGLGTLENGSSRPPAGAFCTR